MTTSVEDAKSVVEYIAKDLQEKRCRIEQSPEIERSYVVSSGWFVDQKVLSSHLYQVGLLDL